MPTGKLYPMVCTSSIHKVLKGSFRLAGVHRFLEHEYTFVLNLCLTCVAAIWLAHCMQMTSFVVFSCSKVPTWGCIVFVPLFHLSLAVVSSFSLFLIFGSTLHHHADSTFEGMLHLMISIGCLERGFVVNPNQPTQRSQSS